MKKWLALSLLLGALTTLGVPSSAGAMTMADVVRLAKGGAGDDVIMSQIEASNDIFTLTVQDILDLKQAGVSDRVLTFMINTGKERGSNVLTAGPATDDSSAEGASPGVAGVDTRLYENLPVGGDTSDDAGYEDLNARYHAGASAGYDWSPYWNISLGWGYGGYYDPWYCGYWPSYWDYYSPFRCTSSYWWCPPRYYGWGNYGYPVYYGNNHHRGGSDRHDRSMKDGRSIYGRGAPTPPGGSDMSSGYGRGYKGQAGTGGGSTAPQRVVSQKRQLNYGQRSGQAPQVDRRPANPPIGNQAPSGAQPGRAVKRDRDYRVPNANPPIGPVPNSPAPSDKNAPQQSRSPKAQPSYGGRGGNGRGTIAPPRNAPPAVAPAPAKKGDSGSSGRTTKKS